VMISSVILGYIISSKCNLDRDDFRFNILITLSVVMGGIIKVVRIRKSLIHGI
jgi:hypothetical protein